MFSRVLRLAVRTPAISLRSLSQHVPVAASSRVLFRQSVRVRPAVLVSVRHNSSEVAVTKVSAPAAQSVVDLATTAATANPDVTTAAVAAAAEKTLIAIPSPVEAIQALVSWLHTTGNVPWWVAIAGTTVLIRTALLPVTLQVLRNGRRLANINPELKAIQERIAAAKSSGDQVAMMKAADDMRVLFRENKCNPFKSLLNIATMAPVFITFFIGLRRMAENHQLWPGLTEGGLAWFSNLAVPDPYYVLPVLSAATMALTIELGSEGMQASQMGPMKWIMRVFAVLSVFFSAQFPAAMLVYWNTTNLYSITQTALLKIPFVRRVLNIPALKDHTKAAAAAGPTLVKPAVLHTQKPKMGKIVGVVDEAVPKHK